MSHGTRTNSEPKGAMETVRDIANSNAGKVLLLGGAAVTWLTGCAPGEAPRPQETSVVVPSPEVTAAPEVVDLGQFNFELDATAEQLGQNFAELSTFQAAGNITQSLSDLRYSEEFTTVPLEEFARAQATEHINEVFNEHYVQNWQENDRLVAYFNFLVNANAGNIQNYVTDPSALDLQFTSTAGSLAENGSGSQLDVTLSLKYEGLAADPNADKLNGQVTNISLGLVAEDGRYRISDWQGQLDQ